MLNQPVNAWPVRILAAVLAAVGLVSWVSFILFFIVGGPFGALTDVGNGLQALLCGALALLLRTKVPIPAVMLAVVGAATGLVGSYLVMTETTGYFLAGLVSALGFALIGVWLIVIARSGDVTAPRLAQVAGAVMALGLVNIPGVLWGLDDQATAPGWLLAAGVSWAGTYLLLPIWALLLARNPVVPSRVTRTQTEAPTVGPAEPG